MVLSQAEKTLVIALSTIAGILIIVFGVVFGVVLPNNSKPQALPPFNFPTLSFSVMPPNTDSRTALAPNFVEFKTFDLPTGFAGDLVVGVIEDFQLLAIGSTFTDMEGSRGGLALFLQNVFGDYVNLRNATNLNKDFPYPNQVTLGRTIENEFVVFASFKNSQKASGYSGIAYFFTYDGVIDLTLQATFTNPGGSFDGDEFGRSVALSTNPQGNPVVYVAQGAFSPTALQGSVQVYVQGNDGTFQIQPTPISPGLLPESYRANWATQIALFQDHLIVTYPNTGTSGDPGAAYFMSYNPTLRAWETTQILSYPGDPTASNRFAFSVAVDRTFEHMVLGAPNDQTGTCQTGTGSVFMYRRKPGDFGKTAWQFVNMTELPCVASALGFGYNVMISENAQFVVVGTELAGAGTFVFRVENPFDGSSKIIARYDGADPQNLPSTGNFAGYSGAISLDVVVSDAGLVTADYQNGSVKLYTMSPVF